MNYSIIFKILSMVFAVMAGAFSVCAGVSVIYADTPLEGEAMPSWICVIALSLMLALAFFIPSRNAPTKLFKKEAMCIIGLAWTLASLVGALPYVLILDCPFATAFFESASGLTTTGASVFASFSEFPHSLMFWRCLSHWIGGLGVVVFFVAILSFLGFGGRILYAHETSANSGGGMETERIQSGAIRILEVYTAISVVCLITFKLCGMGWFDGICHMFATVSTGGFSVYENSIAHYDSRLIDWAVIVFMFIGGVSFTAIILALEFRHKRLAQNTEFWTYLGIITASSFIIFALICTSQPSILDAFTHSVFQTVSIMTTTGLASAPYQNWLPSTHIVLFALMIIGGCAGSTSGGLKVSRAVASFKILLRDVEKSFRPRVVRNITLNGKTLDESDTNSILSFVVLYSFIAIIAFIVFTIFEPDASITTCISSVLSMMGNVGPGFGDVGPDKTYGFMEDHTKIFLSMLMIMGRLEFYAILVLFMPSLWKKFE